MTKSQSISDRFWSKVSKHGHGGCWIWTASVIKGGYGQFRVNNPPRMVVAHQWAWEETNGPVPEGLELDHLCRVPRCVRPDHCEAVTHQENVRRGLGGVLKTHCAQGHPYAGDNLVGRENAWRRCRACDAEKSRRYRARKKERSGH